MTPTLASYIGGTAALLVCAASFSLGAYWLRRLIVPEFSGALARLSELVIGFALLIIALQIAGTLSILHIAGTIACCVITGLVAFGVGYRFARRDVEQIAAPAVPMWVFLLAVAVASWVVAEWSFPSQLSLDQGMFGGDTTWYHMPASARFAQDGSINPLFFSDPLRLAVWFYPQSSELIHGALIVLMQSDWLSPLFNMGALAIALLACWCIGRPYGVGAATLVAGAILLDSGVMIETQPGEGRNDIIAFAFLIAFAAFLINGHQRRAPKAGAVQDAPESGAPLLDRGPLIMAGIAAGIAVSVKLSLLAPVGVIAVGMVLVSGKGRRLLTAGYLGLTAVIVGGYWYFRAMIYTGGNPAPQLKFGPLNLPTPDQMPLDPRPRFSVAHYIADPGIYRYWFFPKLDDALGFLYPLILVMAVAAAIYIALKSRNKILRVVAAAALVTAAVYLFTPLTAAGQEGQPRGFFTNTRYLMPGLLLALTLLPIARPLRVPPGRAHKVLLFLTAGFALSVLTTPKWYPSFLIGTLFITLALVWAPVGLTWLKERGRIGWGTIGGVIAAILVIAIAWGRYEEVDYAEKHYSKERTTLFLQEGGPQEAFAFTRDLKDKRIAIAGSGEIFFGQYGFYGVDLSNHVQYIGQEGDRGTYRLITNCENYKKKINEGDYDYLITSEFTQDSPDNGYYFPINDWIKDDPAVREVVAEPDITPQPDYVYEIRGELDPSLCVEVETQELPADESPG